MEKATANQIHIAGAYKIPLQQAHTINTTKYEQYLKWLRSPLTRLERWFDKQEERQEHERGEIYHG